MCLQKPHFPLEFFHLTFTGFLCKIFKFPDFLGLSLTFHHPFCKRDFSPWLSRLYEPCKITSLSYGVTNIKRATFHPVPSWLPFLMKPKSNSPPDLIRPYHRLKGFLFLSKTCSIQIEPYILLPKVSRKITKTLLTKPKPQFQIIFGKDSFLLNTVPF